MIIQKCNHEWVQFTNSRISPGIGDTSAKFECTKCKVWLNASEVFQLETLAHISGFQKWISIIAIALSGAAFIISFFTYLYK